MINKENNEAYTMFFFKRGEMSDNQINLCYIGLFDVWCCLTPQYFSYIVMVSFIGGGNQRTRGKPTTCCKSLTNFICYIGLCLEMKVHISKNDTFLTNRPLNKYNVENKTKFKSFFMTTKPDFIISFGSIINWEKLYWYTCTYIKGKGHGLNKLAWKFKWQ